MATAVGIEYVGWGWRGQLENSRKESGEIQPWMPTLTHIHAPSAMEHVGPE